MLSNDLFKHHSLLGMRLQVAHTEGIRGHSTLTGIENLILAASNLWADNLWVNQLSQSQRSVRFMEDIGRRWNKVWNRATKSCGLTDHCATRFCQMNKCPCDLNPRRTETTVLICMFHSSWVGRKAVLHPSPEKHMKTGSLLFSFQ